VTITEQARKISTTASSTCTAIMSLNAVMTAAAIALSRI